MRDEQEESPQAVVPSRASSFHPSSLIPSEGGPGCRFDPGDYNAIGADSSTRKISVAIADCRLQIVDEKKEPAHLPLDLQSTI
jgi:hypothetical protein